MSQSEINKEAKEELKAIIDELFIPKIDSKLSERVNMLSEKIEEKSYKISKSIENNKRGIVQKIEDDIEPNLEDLISESKDQNDELLKVNKGVESIQVKLSEIQNENLAEILSNVVKIIKKQKADSENLLLKVDSALKLQAENIISDNSGNRELVKKRLAELQSDVVALINDSGSNQKKNIQDLDKNISVFVDLEKENNLNLHKQLDIKFQSVEQLNSVLVKDFDEKLTSLKAESETQFSKLSNKNNTVFKSLLITNIVIIVILILTLLINFKVIKF